MHAGFTGSGSTTARRRLVFTASPTLLLLLAFAPAASAQPTLDKAFTPDTIGPGSVSTATFTITNGSASPVTGVSFTDTLPAGVTIADPANASTTCSFGAGASLDAPDGGSTITLSGAQVASSGSCVVTVDVTSTTAGMHTNPAITLSSSAGSNMSSAVDLTVDTALPGFSKSFSPASTSLGGRSTLTFTIDNSANGVGRANLSFTDVLPAELEVADPANSSTDCTGGVITAVPGTDIVGYTFEFAGDASVGAGSTCTVTVDVVAIGDGALDNVSGELTSIPGGGGGPASSGKASDTLAVSVTPLALTKAFTDDPVPPGGMVTLELTVYNLDRDFPATGLAFSDDLGAALTDLTYVTLVSNTCHGSVNGLGTTLLSLTGGDVGVEGTCTLQVKLAVPAGAVPGTYLNTTGAVTGTVDGSPLVGNVASETLFVEPVPVLTKEFLEVGTLNPDPIVGPGDDVVLRFSVTNTSTTSAASGITFTDELTDAGPSTGFLPFPVMVTLPPDPNPPCGAGSSLSLNFLGIERQGLVLSSGSLAAGSTCTFDVTLTLPAGLAPGVYTNTTEEVTATVDGVELTGDPGSDTLTVIRAPDLTKEFTDDPVEPGGTVTLEFTLTHSAGAVAPATGINFTDDLTTVLAGLTVNLPPNPDPPCGAGSTLTSSAGNTLLTLMGGSLLPGEDCTFSVTLNVPAGAASGSYPNTTSGVSADVGGFAATSQPASDDLKVAGLTLSKEFVDDPVVPGGLVTLRFTLENVSPTDDASSIAFTDALNNVLPGTPDLTVAAPLPTTPCGATSSLTGTSTLILGGGSLLQGAPPCSFDVVLLVPAGTADGTYANITSPLTAVLGGSSVVLSSATDSLVVDSALLKLTKEFLDDPVAPGDNATLRFTLTNLDGANQASTIAFTDDLEATLSGLVATSLPLSACGGGTVDAIPSASTIDFSGGVLAPGAECFFDVTVTVPGGAAAGTYGNTTSEVTGLINGLAVHGDPGTDDLAVLNLLDFSKSFDGPSVAGGTAVLTFTISNPGSVAASDIFFSDDLNPVISGLVATNLPLNDVCGSGSMVTGASVVTLTGGSIPPSGGMCSFDVDVLVPVTATAGDYLNTTSELYDSGLVVSPAVTATLTIEPPPEFTKSFTPNAVGLGFTSVLTLTIKNTASSLAASDLDFTDNLPAGLLVATPPNASTTCTGGSLTAMASAGSVSYTGGTVGAGATCMVQVDVVTTATGFLSNTTGELTSSSGNSGTASAVLAVDPQPGFSKSFSLNKIAIGGTSTLTFTINNSSATVAATGLDFTDNLPADVVLATPANPATDCTGGTLTAADGASVITYTGGSVAAFSSCSVSVNVTSSTVGTHHNVSGALTSSLGNSGTASADLRVNPAPGFSKAFAPDPTIIGGVVTLTFTIDNTESTASADALDFTDSLPAALLVATPANVMNGCGGMVTATEGTATIHLTGGSVAASSICTLSVDVVTSAAGDIVNTTGDLTSSLTNSGPAEATLRVNPPPIFSKAFVPSTIEAGDTGTLVFSINNTASTADATALDFTDTLPAEITVADPANATTDCGGGIITAVAGTGTVAYTGGIVTAGANCTLSVDVTSSTLGMHTNTSGALTSSLGNSGTADATLTVVDLEPPEVTSVTTSVGTLEECADVRSPISTIGVTVTDSRTPIVGADNTAAYLLVEAGADGDFTTADCSGAAGDDVAVTVQGVTVDATDPLSVVASVKVADPAGLAAGLYRFFVCSTITDTAGNEVVPFEIPFFRADPGNRLVNGHFDDCPATLDPWTPVEVAPNAVLLGVAGTDDSVGSPLSASARMMQSVADPTSFSQCAQVEGDALYDFESWLRYDAPTGAVALFVQACEYFDAAGCTGTSLGDTSVAAVLEDSGGVWSFSESIVHTPAGALSALCTFDTGPLGGNSLFDLYLDGLFFGAGDLESIFSDGFDSGDTSAWTSTVP